MLFRSIGKDVLESLADAFRSFPAEHLCKTVIADTVKGHLSKALELLSDRENPDYQNSIKESISAVESIVNIVIGRANVALNKGLQSLPFEIDNNFKQGMIRLYSWTSSSDGIRHGAHEGEILSGFDEAKYMLVSCCAFINYLISKNESNKVQ